VNPAERAALDWAKGAGLLPAIVQHADDARVLMLGYMSSEALDRTLATGRVTFWSRSRNALWTKGETSGHGLELVSVAADCDRDTLLVRARPLGPTCHTGAPACFPADAQARAVLPALDALVADRARVRPEGSYTTTLFDAGTARIAQKVGEEAVETALAAVTRDDDGLLDEAADLVFHLVVLLRSRGLAWSDLEARLAARRGG
jgi:phosphoribosyl-ATP pyrophosphohydrolase/phosphoribosyl-AMP cyclohydrolase